MKLVYPNLDREIKGRGLNYSKLATAVGLSKSAMYRRISGETDFKISEAVRICQHLGDLDANWLFLRLDTIS